MKNRDILTKSLYTTKMVVCKDFRGIFPTLGESVEKWKKQSLSKTKNRV